MNELGKPKQETAERSGGPPPKADQATRVHLLDPAQTVPTGICGTAGLAHTSVPGDVTCPDCQGVLVEATAKKVRSIQETIAAVRDAGAPAGMTVVHRVRNAATEKAMSERPWCGDETPNPRATILDQDVTCPACLRVLESFEDSRQAVRLTHFHANQWEPPLCGQKSEDQVIELVYTLRETTCERCLNRADELLLGVIADHGPAVPSKATMGDVLTNLRETDQKHLELQEAEVGALRDICAVLTDVRAAVTAWIKVPADGRGGG